MWILFPKNVLDAIFEYKREKDATIYDASVDVISVGIVGVITKMHLI